MESYPWKVLQQDVSRLCEQAIKDRIFSGCVVGCQVGKTQQIWAYGQDDYHEHGSPMHAKRVFDIASLTKVFPVSTLALRAIVRKELELHAPVASFIPEFAKHHGPEATIFHLLTHSLDYRFPLSQLKDLPAPELFQKLCAHPFQVAPGSLFNYGNAASILLGVVLNQLYGLSLQELAQKHIFEPLGLNDSGWNPLTHIPLERIVPTEHCPWRAGLVRGSVHDESAHTLQALGPVGSAGMFSTVPDVMRFMEWVLDSPELLALITQNALPHLPGQCTGLGWELANPRFMGGAAGARTFGKTGFTGQSIVADPEKRRVLVLLSNFTWPQREKTPDRIYTVRAQLADCFLGKT